MHPKDFDTSSPDSGSDRRDQNPQRGQPFRSAPRSRSGENAPDGPLSKDEDSGQGSPRLAGGSNSGQRRESPDDIMRRERSRQEPRLVGGQLRQGLEQIINKRNRS